jgi:Zn-finger nucleic acid-binding protein
VSTRVEVPLENDLDLIHVNCMTHFVFQTKDVKNNILFYVCPRCSLVIMVGEMHPEEQEQAPEEQPVEQAEPSQEQAPEEQPQEAPIEKHKRRKNKVSRNSDE